jgi:phosphoglycolate phosphatase-like HAD superfamily hydrolase
LYATDAPATRWAKSICITKSDFYPKRMRAPMTERHLIVFDMDGVIIDVSRSYRDVVRQTVRMFFSPAPFFKDLPDPLFSLSELGFIKQTGGLNNDWDLTCRVIELLGARVVFPDDPRPADPWQRFERIVSRCRGEEMGDFLRSTDTPLSDLLKDEITPVPVVRSFYTGDVGTGNIIKQIFQETYLGQDLFWTTYGEPPRLHIAEGYIHRETLLMEKTDFAKLADRHTLAIATGRPAGEAAFALDRFQIRRFFSRVMTLDNCLREESRILAEAGHRVSLQKPDPYMLDVIHRQLSGGLDRCYYIGDMPDDMIAASSSRTGYIGIGFVGAAPDRDRLKGELIRRGARHVVHDFRGLSEIVE